MHLPKLNNREKAQGLAILVLLLLAVISEAAMLWTWFHVLEPQLREKAEITARALAQSRIALLGDSLTGGRDKIDPARIREAMDSLMLITDPVTDNPVILGIELEVDPEVVHVDPSLFPFSHGRVDCPDCFVTEVPVYATRTRELLGIARFYNSSEFYRLFIADVRTRLLAISVLVVALFVAATIFLILLFRKTHAVEQQLREQQAQLIHAGRITAMGEMATGIAHEINQPLTIIRLAADGLNRYFEKIGQKSMEARAAGKIVSQVDRCVTIIDNMRSFVRNTPHGDTAVNLVEALERALSMPVEEQRDRNAVMRARLERYDTARWADDFITQMEELREMRKVRLPKRLRGRQAERLIQAYRGAERRLLLLDYDGTLVEFAPTPQGARPDDRLLEMLRRLAANARNTVVIISGRDAATLEEWLGATGVDLVAEHGARRRLAGEGRWVGDGEPLGEDWKKQLRPVLEIYVDRTPGALLEEKGQALVWHYRRAEPGLGAQRAAELIETLEGYVANTPLHILQGHKVVEIKPSTVSKGRAAQPWLSPEHSHDFILAIGDDVTDEALFEILPEGSWSVKVGIPERSKARFFVSGTAEVRELLDRIAALEGDI